MQNAANFRPKNEFHIWHPTKDEMIQRHLTQLAFNILCLIVIFLWYNLTSEGNEYNEWVQQIYKLILRFICSNMGVIFYKRNGTTVIVRKLVLVIHPSGATTDKWIRCGPSLLVSAPSPPTVPAWEYKYMIALLHFTRQSTAEKFKKTWLVLWSICVVYTVNLPDILGFGRDLR
jgi:hypothetical protein